MKLWFQRLLYNWFNVLWPCDYDGPHSFCRICNELTCDGDCPLAKIRNGP